MNLDTPSWKNQFLYPFLELIGSWVMLYLSNKFWYPFMTNQFLYPFLEFMSQRWCFTFETNLDTPSWKTNFYIPFWNWEGNRWCFTSQMNLDTPSSKNQFWYPFLEFVSQGWCFTSQTNLDSPSWKASFYSPFWNLWVKGNALPLKRILIPLPEKPISISLFGIHESRVILYLPNEFWYPFMKNQFLYSFMELIDQGWGFTTQITLIGLHEKPISMLLMSQRWRFTPQMNLDSPSWKNEFLTVCFFLWMKKNWHHSFSCGV